MKRGRVFSDDPRTGTDAKCTNCAAVLDAASHGAKTGARPKGGDIGLCVYCGHIMAFCDDLSLRDLTEAEMQKIAGDRDLVAMQRVGQAFREARKR